MYIRLQSIDGKLPCPEEMAEVARVLGTHGFEVVGGIAEHSRGGLVLRIDGGEGGIDLQRLDALVREMRYRMEAH